MRVSLSSRWYLLLSAIAIVFLLSPLSLICQERFFSSQGRDFFIAFPPNLHGDSPSNDSLFLFVSTEQPVSGMIYAVNRIGRRDSTSFRIDNPDSVYRYSVPWGLYELRGFNQATQIFPPEDPLNRSGRLSIQHFRVQTNAPVTVYGLSQAGRSSDAFLALPVETLDTAYVVVSYANDEYAGDDGFDTPTQYVVTATEDSTVVRVANRQRAYRSDSLAIPIVMNKGQSLLVQIQYRGDQQRSADLTGSKVNSSKPVAVFGSQQRARVPYGELGQFSRDFLCEQIAPISTWGKNSIVMPFEGPVDAPPFDKDVYRVIPSVDRTQIWVNDTLVGTYGPGNFMEAFANGVKAIRASEPVQVAYYRRSARPTETELRMGDPFMIAIPPTEQFLRAYRFVNVQAPDYTTNADGTVTPDSSVYKLQYATLVFETDDSASVRIDNRPLSDYQSKRGLIPGSGYSYAHVSMTDGVHTAQADKPFGLYVYGYGFATSYGYVGGMNLRPIDKTAPQFRFVSACDSVIISVTDSSRSDRGLASVVVDTGLLANIQVVVPEISSPARLLTLTARLANLYADGRIALRATDSAGLSRSISIDLPGFTIGVDSSQGNLLSLDLESVAERQVCTTITVRNYGRFTQEIERIVSVHPALSSVVTALPFSLAPGDSAAIRVCYLADTALRVSDTIRIGKSCLMRELAQVVFSTFEDSRPPSIDYSVKPCDSVIEVRMSDSGARDLGIKDVRLESNSQNVTLLRLSIAGATAEAILGLTDLEADAFFSLAVTDSAGNTRSIRDSVPGLVLTFPGTVGDSLDLGAAEVGSIVSRRLQLSNVSFAPVTLSDIWLEGNTLFSLPPSTSPMFVAAESRGEIPIVYSPTWAFSERDTDILHLSNGCRTRRLVVFGQPLPSSIPQSSRCRIPLSVNNYGTFPGYAAFSIASHPHDGQVLLATESQRVASVGIAVFGIDGVCVVPETIYGVNEGTSAISVYLGPLSAGVYVLTLRIGASASVLRLLVAQ